MKISYIVIHCADTPDDKSFDASDIHNWHKQRGWDGIGYHKVIKKNGDIEEGRPEYWSGAHVKGHNHHSLGVCLIGRNEFNEAQWESLFLLLNEWREKYPAAKIVGHYELDGSKTCPNFNVTHYVNALGLR